MRCDMLQNPYRILSFVIVIVMISLTPTTPPVRHTRHHAPREQAIANMQLEAIMQCL